jgi:hypothetical protein
MLIPCNESYHRKPSLSSGVSFAAKKNTKLGASVLIQNPPAAPGHSRICETLFQPQEGEPKHVMRASDFARPRWSLPSAAWLVRSLPNRVSRFLAGHHLSQKRPTVTYQQHSDCFELRRCPDQSHPSFLISRHPFSRITSSPKGSLPGWERPATKHTMKLWGFSRRSHVFIQWGQRFM